MQQPIGKQPRLCAFDKKAPLDTSAYRLVQISCQTQANKASTNCYCLLLPDYQLTYQAFAKLWQAYFNTNQLQLTHYDQNIPLETNQNPIHWDTEANKTFSITLPATLPTAALCRLDKAAAPAKTGLEKGKTQQAAQQKPVQKQSQKESSPKRPKKK